MKLCPICATSYPDGHRTCPTHGAVLVDTPELQPGTIIRDCYRIERTLGKGGMGIVYLAEHTLMGEPRALKFLSGALASNPTFVQRFLQEARAANKLRHPNIAQTLELGQSEDGSFYISMEFVDGPSLRAILDQSPFGMPPERAFNIVRGVAEALGAAHAKHMVHRDIKPENILLAWNSESETAKVVDFGIVAITDSVGRLTQTGKPLMTAQYASPEQWRGTIAPSELDGRTDLYALGCMFYEMLTGQLPYRSESYEGWFEQHVHGIPVPPSQIRPELAEYPGLDTLVLRLMAKEREDRPANVRAFLADLEMVVARKGLASAPAAPGPIAAAGPGAVGSDLAHRGRTTPDTAGQQHPAAGLNPAAGLISAAGLTQNGLRQSQGAHAAAQPRLSKRAQFIFRSVGALVLLAVCGMVLALILRKDETSKDDRGSGTGNGPGASSASSNASGSGSGSGVPAASPASSASGRSVASGDVRVTPRPKPPVITPSSPSIPSGVPSPSSEVAATAKQAKALYSQKKYAEAAPLFTQSCTRGDADSCDYLGWMYEYHLGVDQNYTRAIALYDRGCVLGSMASCNNEGAMNEDGVGVAQNWSRAVDLYKRSCDGGSANGCDALGYMHQTGHGVAQNYQEALSLYDKSCNGNSMGGCKDLGWMYQHGLGVKQDYDRAFNLYTKACDGEDSVACHSLGVMYEEHQGVPEDDARAVFFYTKACDKDNGNACADLGAMYRSGKGTPKDPDKAKAMMTKGCNLGSKFGCDQLKEIQAGKG